MCPLSTKRLEFRALVAENVAILDALNNAPGVMTYLDRKPPTLENVKTVLVPEQLRIAREYPGFGMRLAYQHDSQVCLGWFKLEPNRPEHGDAEIG